MFEIGDHGSIIVMAKDKDYATTREVEYSFDEGLSWKTLEISDTLIEVNNIVTEPSNVATAFLVIGQTLPDSEGKQVGVAIAIDFAQLLTRTCTGAATPDENGSDYEKWTPHGYKDRRCLLGKTVTYSRKKRGAICLNGEVNRHVASEYLVSNLSILSHLRE